MPNRSIAKSFFIDIDNTLSTTYLGLAEHLLGQELYPEPISPQILSEMIDIDRSLAFLSPHARERVSELLQSDTFLLSLPLMDKAKEGTQALLSFGSINGYLTSRPHSQLEITQQWLDKQALPSAPLVCRELHQQDLFWKLDYLNDSGSRHQVLIEDSVEEFHQHIPQFKGQILWFNPYQRRLPTSYDNMSQFSSWANLTASLSDLV